MTDLEDYDENVADMIRGDDYDDDLGLDSPTDGDEYEMNPDDAFEDPYDPWDIEYDR